MTLKSFLPRPSYGSLPAVRNTKQNETFVEGLHPSEIMSRDIASHYFIPQLPLLVDTVAQLSAIAHNNGLRDLYSSTTDFLAERDDWECPCLEGFVCPFGPFELPDDEDLDTWASNSFTSDDEMWPVTSEPLDEYVLSEVLFDADEYESDASAETFYDTDADESDTSVEVLFDPYEYDKDPFELRGEEHLETWVSSSPSPSPSTDDGFWPVPFEPLPEYLLTEMLFEIDEDDMYDDESDASAEALFDADEFDIIQENKETESSTSEGGLFDVDELFADWGFDVVQEVEDPAQVHTEVSPEISPLGSYFDYATMQMAGYTALDAIKEPSPEASRVGAYFDGRLRRMVGYTALNQMCSLDKTEVYRDSDVKVTSRFAEEFCQFPEPVFSYDEQAAWEEDTTSSELGTEHLDEPDMELRIDDASLGSENTNKGDDKSLKSQLQVEYDAISDVLACSLNYELDHDTGRLKRTNRVPQLGLVVLTTVEEEDEPCVAVSDIPVTGMLDFFSDLFDEELTSVPAAAAPEHNSPGYCSCSEPCTSQFLDSRAREKHQATQPSIDGLFPNDEWCSSSYTALNVPSSLPLGENSQLPGQLFPKRELLQEISTEVDGLLTNIFAQFEAGKWSKLPALGCDLHQKLRALSENYPVLGTMERLGAAVETLVESAAALESVRMDLVGNGGSAWTNN